MFDTVLNFLVNFANHWLTHVIALGISGWAVLSCLANWLLWWKSPEQWVAAAEQKTFLAKVINLLKHWGVNPVDGLKTLQALFKKEAPGNPLPEPPSTDTKQ